MNLYEEFLNYQKFIDKGLKYFNSLDLELNVSLDMEEWKQLIISAPGNAGINLSFDADYSNISTNNCFWINLQYNKNIIATVVQRLYIIDDWDRFLLNSHIWYDKKPVICFKQYNIVYPNNAPKLTGKVCQGGGGWVHPDFRGNNLIYWLPRIARIMSARQWNWDHLFAYTSDSEKRRNLFLEAYGYTKVFSFIEDEQPVKDFNYKKTIIGVMSKQEHINSLI